LAQGPWPEKIYGTEESKFEEGKKKLKIEGENQAKKITNKRHKAATKPEACYIKPKDSNNKKIVQAEKGACLMGFRGKYGSKDENTMINKIIKETEKRAFKYFPENFKKNDSIDIKILEYINKKNTTFFYKLLLSNGKNNHTLWVRISAFSKNLDKLKASRIKQRQTLQYFWDKFKPHHHEFSLSRQLDLMPEFFYTIITEHCEGQVLEKYLKAKNPQKMVLDIISRCGEWLSIMHEKTKKNLNQAYKIKNLQKNFTELIIKNKIDKRTVRQLQQIYNQEITKIKSFNEMVMIHGDFWPKNIIVSETKISVIDFLEVHQDIRYEDIGKFLAYIITMRTKNNLKFTYKMKDEFIKGYMKRSESKLDYNLVLFFILYHLLDLLNSKKDFLNSIIGKNLYIKKIIKDLIFNFSLSNNLVHKA